MENLVTSLETSKKLKAAGWIAPTLFHWDGGSLEQQQPSYSVDGFNAPTAQEIADQFRSSGMLNLNYDGGHWIAANNITATGDTMAEALALLWLKLKEPTDER